MLIAETNRLHVAGIGLFVFSKKICSSIIYAFLEAVLHHNNRYECALNAL